MARKLVGTILCLNPHCGTEIPAKESEGGALNVSCPYCDFSAYAKQGTKAHADLSRCIKVKAPEPEAAPAPAPSPTAAPARATAFG